MQGLYGLFPFTVTEAEVCTFRDFKMNRELSYAEHKCLSGLSKLQHTGRNLDTASLNVQIVPLRVLATAIFQQDSAICGLSFFISCDQTLLRRSMQAIQSLLSSFHLARVQRPGQVSLHASKEIYKPAHAHTD